MLFVYFIYLFDFIVYFYLVTEYWKEWKARIIAI